MCNLKPVAALLCLAIAASVAAADTSQDKPWPLVIQQPPKLNFCQGCRSIVSYAGRFNSTEHRAEHKELFKNFCELYYPVSTDFQQGPCPFFVEGLYKVLDSIDPVHHCDQIGACQYEYATGLTVSGDTSSESPPLFSMLSAIPNNRPQSLEQSKICSACEQLVRTVQQNLEDPKAIDQLRKKLDAFCDYLKVVGEDKECRQVVNQNIDNAVDFIRNVSPHQYCQSIQLCQSNGKKQDVGQKFLPTLADFNNFGIETSVEIGGQTVNDLNSLNYKSGPMCVFCKTLIKEMFKFLKDNRTEENIRFELGHVCKLVFQSGPKFDQCEQMIAAYSEELIQFLVDETDPELICMMLAQCTYQVAPMALTVTAPTLKKVISPGELISLLDPSIKVGSMKSCIECKLFIEYLQNTVNDPKSREDIRKWLLTNLCNKLSEKELKDSCTNMVDGYSDAFFKAISEQLNPQSVCVDMHACRAPPPTIPSFISSNQSPGPAQVFNLAPIEKPEPIVNAPPKEGQSCDQCVDIVSRIDEYLSANSVDHDVSVLIDEVCNKLPSDAAKSECTLLVKIFGQDIVQAISTMESPRQLCSRIMLC